jgi:hypothetical protein
MDVKIRDTSPEGGLLFRSADFSGRFIFPKAEPGMGEYVNSDLSFPSVGFIVRFVGWISLLLLFDVAICGGPEEEMISSAFAKLRLRCN